MNNVSTIKTILNRCLFCMVCLCFTLSISIKANEADSTSYAYFPDFAFSFNANAGSSPILYPPSYREMMKNFQGLGPDGKYPPFTAIVLKNSVDVWPDKNIAYHTKGKYFKNSNATDYIEEAVNNKEYGENKLYGFPKIYLEAVLHEPGDGAQKGSFYNYILSGKFSEDDIGDYSTKLQDLYHKVQDEGSEYTFDEDGRQPDIMLNLAADESLPSTMTDGEIYTLNHNMDYFLSKLLRRLEGEASGEISSYYHNVAIYKLRANMAQTAISNQGINRFFIVSPELSEKIDPSFSGLLHTVNDNPGINKTYFDHKYITYAMQKKIAYDVMMICDKAVYQDSSKDPSPPSKSVPTGVALEYQDTDGSVVKLSSDYNHFRDAICHKLVPAPLPMLNKMTLNYTGSDTSEPFTCVYIPADHSPGGSGSLFFELQPDGGPSDKCSPKLNGVLAKSEQDYIVSLVNSQAVWLEKIFFESGNGSTALSCFAKCTSNKEGCPSVGYTNISVAHDAKYKSYYLHGITTNQKMSCSN